MVFRAKTLFQVKKRKQKIGRGLEWKQNHVFNCHEKKVPGYLKQQQQ